MAVRTPVTLITGALGSGKTTLLRHLMGVVPHVRAHACKKLAILMNEFGAIAIDSQIIEGKNVRMVELGGGCVCCALLGEFEAAVAEIIDSVHPDLILVETTGVAEPEALVVDIQESLPQVRLDSVVTVADADALWRYPSWGHTTRAQLEAADLILLNKVDLVSAAQLAELKDKLARLNAHAAILPTQRCRVDPDVLFGFAGEPEDSLPPHVRAHARHRHQPEVETFSYVTAALLERDCFERFAAGLSPVVVRAKGFVRFSEGTYLFNFVAGRWELEPFVEKSTTLVFIGAQVTQHQAALLTQLKACER